MSNANVAQAPVANLNVSPLGGDYGVRVEGVDITTDMSDATMQALSDLVFEHRIVVLANQNVDDATYVTFGHKWGKPIDFFKDDHRDVVHRELIKVENGLKVPMEHRDGAVQWHNDSSYDELPSSITMLYCMESPDEGGETLFADIVAAYDALPADMRARIQGKVASHTMLGAPALECETIDKMKGPEWGHYLHPLVYDHPIVSGRKSLYTSATAQSIDGMDYEEGRALIRELRQHSFDGRFENSYKLQKGDLIIWDNFSVAHSATPIEYSDEPGKYRLLQRISTKGRPDYMPNAVS